MELDAKYYFVNSVFMNMDDIIKMLNKEDTEIDSDKGFLYTETIYKLKGGSND